MPPGKFRSYSNLIEINVIKIIRGLSAPVLAVAVMLLCIFVLQVCKVLISLLLCAEHKRLPPKRTSLRRVLVVRHLESWPGLHLPPRPQIGTLEPSAVPGASEGRPVRVDPMARQMELGKSH